MKTNKKVKNESVILTKTIGIRISEEFYLKLSECAKKDKRKISDFARIILENNIL